MQNQENENRMGYSRILKFRAWDKISKSMHEVGALNFSDETVGFEVRLAAKGTFGYSERFTNVILMQYTGLKDKNGKEIFCKDILSHPDVPNSEFYVRWNNERARFQLESKEGKELMGQLFDNEYFIIGNEYEGIA